MEFNYTLNNETYTNLGSSYFDRYVYSLYWATATMGTIGYGDIVGISIPEKIVSIIIIAIGEACGMGLSTHHFLHRN